MNSRQPACLLGQERTINSLQQEKKNLHRAMFGNQIFIRKNGDENVELLPYCQGVVQFTWILAVLYPGPFIINLVTAIEHMLQVQKLITVTYKDMVTHKGTVS